MRYIAHDDCGMKSKMMWVRKLILNIVIGEFFLQVPDILAISFTVVFSRQTVRKVVREIQGYVFK